MKDASTVWWDLRPSARFPTLETRVMDVATNLDHAVSLVALTQCLTRMLFRARQKNQRWRVYANMLVNENRWRAMRYAFDDGLIDLARSEVVPYGELLEELIQFVAEDADALGCTEDIEGLRNIVATGTSAHHQLAVFKAALEKGRSHDEALCDVVDQLIAVTAQGL